MESKRPSSDTGRRLASSYTAQDGNLAVLINSPEFPITSRIRRRSTESAEQRLSGLEALRRPLVQAVLDARELCERTSEIPLGPEASPADGSAPVSGTPTFGQLLVCAAVKDLEELDDRLHEARLRG
ncbi:hypothetical protein IWX64_000836 [Arthrobacter sp. CAN_A212]|uniref:hypothetical protein n=1 Tax=unclassified Arthrobacter TaxID=235627 RepID=UPI0018CA0F73|nr:hypothetical protein [Arthrobacter sp. CAN_C5]MBP2216277.1 hypothetical protein [Arthrobacter sp. CAN_C5]